MLTGPAIVCIQAWQRQHGCVRPWPRKSAGARMRCGGAWVHVDGAFGLWAAASPEHRHLAEGIAGRGFLGHRRT